MPIALHRANRPTLRALALAVAALLITTLVPAARSARPTAIGDPINVIVRQVEGMDLTATIDQLGGTVTSILPIINGFAAELTPDAVEALEAHPGVLAITPNVTLGALGHHDADEQHDSDFDAAHHAGSLYNVARYVNADDLWKRGTTGSGIDIALIDSGISPVAGLDGSNKVVNAIDLSFDSGLDEMRYLDAYGHGTHMAGIIAGRDADITGNLKEASKTSFVGIAPEARLVNVKVGDAQGVTDVSQVIAAIDWVVQHRTANGMNIRVLNLSYGTDGLQDYELDPLAFATEQAWVAGIVVVVAAGNDGNAAPLRNPASDPFTIAVGAVDTQGTPSPRDDGIATFSSCGTPSRSVDIVAPGRSVLSLRTPGSYADLTNPSAVVGDRFFAGTGTSQAAAVVSGSVALLLQDRPDLGPDEVKAILMGSADSIRGESDLCQGAGLVDLKDARRKRLKSDEEQDHDRATGLGSLNASRGSDRITANGVALDGERDAYGRDWDAEKWASKARSRQTWSGGSWSGGSWSGGSWSGGSWSGGSWSGGSWSGGSWSGTKWSGKAWTGSVWLTDAWR